MQSITKFLDPGIVPEVTGDDLDVDKELDKKSDLSSDSDTVEVDLSKDADKPKVSNVVLPGKKESGLEQLDSGESESESGEESEGVPEKSEDESSGEESISTEDSSEGAEESISSEPEQGKDDEKEEDAAETAEEKVEAEKESDDLSDDSVTDPETDESEQTAQDKPEEGEAGDEEKIESDLDADQNKNAPLLKVVSEYEFYNTKVYETPFGARIVYINKPSELCYCSFDFKVGSFYEDDSNRGISHLIEHLMFNGCPGMSSLEFAEKMDRLGMSINAYTDRMLTSYHFSGLKANFVNAFDLYFNLLSSFTVTQPALDKERGVVINEIGVRDDDNWCVLSETVLAQAYRQHPATHPVIGYEDVIRNISMDQVTEYYTKNYNVKNLTLYLVGDFIEEDLVFAAEKINALRDGEKNIDPVITDSMALPFYKNVIMHKDGAVQTLIDSSIMLKNEAFNFYNLDVLAEVLGGTMSSYLWNEFREERSIAYRVGAYAANLDPQHLKLHLYAGLNDSDDAELAKSLFKDAFNYAKSIPEDVFNKGLNIVISEKLKAEETEEGIKNGVSSSFYFGFDPDAYNSTFKNLTYDSYKSFVEQVDPESMLTGILYPSE